MGTLLITSFLLLGIIVLVLYRQRRASSAEDSASRVLPPDERFAGLFGAQSTGRERKEGSASAPEDEAAKERRAQLLSSAAEGERATLAEAHASGDALLYDEVLNLLVERAARSDAQLLALVSYITRRDDLRVNHRLAAAFLESWRRNPDRSATAKMLHLSALADDADVYRAAVEAVLQFWREGRLRETSAAELRSLTDGEYWLLSARTRSSGAGFILKRTLARLRGELEAGAQAGRGAG